MADLSGWDFDRLGAVDLVGEWRVDGDRLVVQPAPWNRVGLSALGRHTLSLTLKLPPGGPPLALSAPDITSAVRVLIDGREVGGSGRPADDRAGEVPVLQRLLVLLPAGARQVELALDVSNFHHFEGGVVRAVRVGSAVAFQAEQMRLKAVPLLAFGALGMVMLLLPAFWLGGKRETVFLVFALFTALVAWRTFAVGQLYTLTGQDVRADIWYLPAAYISMYGFPGIYFSFLRALFPVEAPRKLAWPAYAVSGVMVAVVLATGPETYTRWRDPFQALVLLTPLLGTVVLVAAWHRRRFGAGWVLAGSLLFAASVINDSLHYLRVINTTDLTPLGFASFAVAYCAALALRLFRSERQASERLAALNRALEDKVLERTASLERAKAEAEQASSAKSEFLAVMSHEIRTPLHGWAGLTELLESTGLDERQRHYVGLLRRTAEHLTRLIGDILDMSRIEAGRLELNPEPFRPRDLAEELAALARAQAADKGLEFRLEVAPGLPEAVRGDVGAIRQIVLNFLGNAAKFTRAGHIALSIAPGDQGLRFTVADTGCGIPADRLGDIFETFTQVDSSIRRRHGGSGLGLAICRRLAELMGGSVGAVSQLGEGTTVWCELPLAPCEPSSAPSAPLHSLPPGTRVLVADDVELNRLVLREFLAGTGAVVVEAGDGLEAVTKVAAGGYGLAVLDLRMPGLDGFEVARAIRRREAELGLPALPLAALSAGAAPADRQAAAEAGFTVFLAKPIDRPALIAALAALLPGDASMASLPPPPDIPEGLEHMLPLFVAEMEKDAARLRELAEGDVAILAEHAHAMRGKAAMFGETTLFTLLSRIEELAVAGDRQPLPALVMQVLERSSQLGVYGRISTAEPS
ncbi:MAG: ATP-binding protein [Magnetospirillum sp.]|nr:ATP-binding protein [Magnetospirillum sp.]